MATTSKHLLGATELTVLADIKEQLTTLPEPTTYAQRLRALLDVLFLLRQTSVEETGLLTEAGPLEGLRSLHRVHWSIIDERKLHLTVAFDGPWEPYIRRIVDVAGPLLDIIFCHCSGYVGHSCYDGYAAFAEWVRQRQVSAGFFYAASPQRTVDDVTYLEAFERRYSTTAAADFEQLVPSLHVGAPPRKAHPDRFTRAGLALLRLRRFFPGANAASSSNDAFLFDRAAALILRGLNPDPLPEPTTPGQVALRQWWDTTLGRKGFLLPAAHQQQHDAVDIAQVQGNILTAYQGMTHGCVALARFESRQAGAAFLARLAPLVTTEAAEQAGKSGPIRINVGITYQGLAALGLQPQQLELLPKEFQEGMEARAGMLGDVGPSYPSRWKLPTHDFLNPEDKEKVALSTVDIVLMLQTQDASLDHKLQPSLEVELRKLAGAELQILHVQPLHRRYEKRQHPDVPKNASGMVREHFGQIDGISQPRPRLVPSEAPLQGDEVQPGELLLGYANDRGDSQESDPLYRLPRQLLQGSSFWVMRKLEQDVAAFKALQPDQVAKLLGRLPDGQPLVDSKDQWNDFDFKGDADAKKCPFFAHVRRTNPRQDEIAGDRPLRVPRIMRRGFGYGSRYEEKPDESERGLMFMAYNASIADQFEVLQRWVNGGNSAGGLSSHPDLIGGAYDPGQAGRQLRYVDVEGRVVSVTVPEKPYVQLHWGLYLFAPSVAALHELSKIASQQVARTEDPRLLAKAAQTMDELRLLATARPEAAFLQWKRLLEDRDHRFLARAIWAVVRERGGVWNTGTEYGVLVGSEKTVSAVLAEDDKFSVREYWDRMGSSFGVHYLGMDRKPKPLWDGDPYPKLCEDNRAKAQQDAVNAYLKKIPFTDVFLQARQATRTWFDDKKAPKQADMSELARVIIGGIAQQWFGLPDGKLMTTADEASRLADPTARCPIDFQRVSQYIFHPHPTESLKDVGQERGEVVLQAVEDACQAGLQSRLLAALPEGTDPKQATTGSINGFSVPTSGSFLSVIHQWTESGDLLRLQRWLRSVQAEGLRAAIAGEQVGFADLQKTPLYPAMIRAMIGLSIPDLLHRTVVEEKTLGEGQGAVTVKAKQRVVISLSSAASEGGFAPLLFGQVPEAAGTAPHACPGQPMAYGALLGMLVGILEQTNLRRVARLVLTCD